MAVRLHLKIGLVPAGDRLTSSPDAVLHHEPSIGATSRSKGNLYGIVTVRPGSGGRAADAAALVAETIRERYYYDESAGIPICLEKAIRTANQQLRHGREGHGLESGSLGAVIAVVRGHELYVATIGDADAYLVRQARLLTLPEEERGAGLPSAADPRVDVWRGEIAVGDSLLLVSRNVTRTVGVEEFKNALVTLHPQSAVEHLHHLFAAAAAEGSDALLALEVAEVPVTRAEHRLVPVRPAEPLAGVRDRSPIPLADPVAAAASAVGSRARDAREAAGGALAALVERITDLLPRRRARYRRITPLASRRDSQRRAGVAALSFVGLVAALGIGLWVLGGALPGKDEQITDVNAGEQALQAARGRISQVFDNGDLVTGNKSKALLLLRQAWTELGKAEGLGVAAATIRPLRTRVAGGLDRIYAVRLAATSVVLDLTTELSPKADIVDMVRGPDGAAYVVDRATASIFRVDLSTGDGSVVVTKGDGAGDGIGEPWLLALGGPDVFILDRDAALWRWRPSDAEGRGTLARLRLGGDTSLGDDVRDMATYARNADSGLYFLYVVDPSSRQILRYPPAADGSGFPAAPNDYLAAATDVSGFRQLFIDGDAYVLGSDVLTRYQSGRADDFALALPPDGDDLRPGHDYRLMAALPARREGRIWVWDAEHERVLAFSKLSGDYLEQFVAESGGPPLRGVRAMFVVDRGAEKAPVLVWADPGRLLATPLEQAPEPGASPSPAGSGSPGASAPPAASPSKSPVP
jgi:hypothetical protein